MTEGGKHTAEGHAPDATIPADKQLYQRQIKATNRQINALVSELYGLTEKDIQIVWGGTNLR